MNLKTFSLRPAADIMPESVPAIKREGATASPSVPREQVGVSKTVRMVPNSILKEGEFEGETIEGSTTFWVVSNSTDILELIASASLRTCPSVEATLSPGRILRVKLCNKPHI